MLRCVAVSAEAPRPPHESEPPPAHHSPVRDLRETLRQLHSRYLIALLLVYALAATVGMAVVVANPVRDWLFFGAMYLVIAAYMILYIKAHLKKRRVIRFVSLFTTEVLLVFWAWILVDRIAPQKVYVDGRIFVRPELRLLWVPVVLLAIVALGLVLHWAWIGRFHERLNAKEEQPVSDQGGG